MRDYVLKPFRLSVLIPRIRALMRTRAFGGEAPLKIGPYMMSQGTLINVLTCKTLKLTEKEVEILKFFKQAEGQTITKDELLLGVWGYSAAMNTHTLETHIYRLRQKIETDPKAASIILTAPGGYRLVTT